MKRIVTLLLAAGLMLGASTAAQAVEINVSGVWDFTYEWGNKGGNKLDPGMNEGRTSNNVFYQRIRTQIDFTASESLNGVLALEIGDTVWGRSNNAATAGRGMGGGLGADGVQIEVKRAYLDWIVPNTELKVRMGIQGFSTPALVNNSNQVFDDDVAGITLNYQFTPNVGATAWWFRPFSDNNPDNFTSPGGRIVKRQWNDMDMFGLAVPLTFDGIKITPWGMYSTVGRDIYSNENGEKDYFGPTAWATYNQMLPRWMGDKNGALMKAASTGQGSAWWGGLTGDITLWNPFRLAFDFNYGSVDMGHVDNPLYGLGLPGNLGKKSFDMARQGWIAQLLAEYKLDFMTPGLVFWYGSGDDKKITNGSEMMPSIKASSKLTSFGQDGAGMNFMGCGLETGLAGTWGIVAQLKDISFVEDLKHTFRVAYYRGTNSKDMTLKNGGPMISPWMNTSTDPAWLYMTTKDSAWEFNLDNTYNIYKNLQLGVELGYIKLDISNSAWGKQTANNADDMYKIGVGLRYTF